MEADEKLIQKIAAYQPSEEKLTAVRDVPMLLACGISGAGKDTVLHKLIETHPNDYHFLISHTTRAPRLNNGVMEQDGVKYFFIGKEAATQMLDAGEYLEANYFVGNVYGTSLEEVARTGREHKILVSDIDVNGIENYMKHGMNARPVFLLPPSYEVWQQRLLKRYGEAVDKDDLRQRLETALDELDFALAHEYFYLVVNDDLDETVELVDRIAHGDDEVAQGSRAAEIAQEIATGIEAQLANL